MLKRLQNHCFEAFFGFNLILIRPMNKREVKTAVIQQGLVAAASTTTTTTAA